MLKPTTITSMLPELGYLVDPLGAGSSVSGLSDELTSSFGVVEPGISEC